MLNKIDLVHPDALMPKIENIKPIWILLKLPISALEGLNVDHFIDVLKDYLPEGPNITLMIKYRIIQNNL